MTHLYKQEITLIFREIISGISVTGLPAGSWNMGSLWEGEHVAPPGEGDSSVQAHNMTRKSIWDEIRRFSPVCRHMYGTPPVCRGGRGWSCNFTDPEWLICTSVKLTQQSISDERRRFSLVCRHMHGTPPVCRGSGGGSVILRTQSELFVQASMKLAQQSIWDERRQFSPVWRHMSGTPPVYRRRGSYVCIIWTNSMRCMFIESGDWLVENEDNIGLTNIWKNRMEHSYLKSWN